MHHRVLAFLALVGAVSCNDLVTGLEPPSDPATEVFAAATGVDIATMTKLPNGLYYRDIVVGTGPVDTANTDSVSVSYMGMLKTGAKFDSGTAVKLQPTGVGLIVGFQVGLLGMKEGGKRKLVIPSALGYGPNSQRDLATGQIKIPRQSTLVFDIDLVKVFNPADSTTGSIVAPSAGARATPRQ